MATAATASSAPPPPPPAEAAAPVADPPLKEEPQSAAADAPAPVGDAGAASAAEGAVGETVVLDAAGEGTREEEGECGFCLFMKGGGCKEEFVGWEKCVEEVEKSGDDVVERCYEATAALHKCMEAHADYYQPILSAELAMAADLEAAKASDQATEASDAAASSQQPLPPPPTEEQAAGEKKQAEAEALVPEKQDVAA